MMVLKTLHKLAQDSCCCSMCGRALQPGRNVSCSCATCCSEHQLLPGHLHPILTIAGDQPLLLLLNQLHQGCAVSAAIVCGLNCSLSCPQLLPGPEDLDLRAGICPPCSS